MYLKQVRDLKALKYQESYGLCPWKLINRKKDMAHSFTGFKISGFKTRTTNKQFLDLTIITARCLDEYANRELNILVVKK